MHQRGGWNGAHEIWKYATPPFVVRRNKRRQWVGGGGMQTDFSRPTFAVAMLCSPPPPDLCPTRVYIFKRAEEGANLNKMEKHPKFYFYEWWKLPVYEKKRTFSRRTRKHLELFSFTFSTIKLLFQLDAPVFFYSSPPRNSSTQKFLWRCRKVAMRLKRYFFLI